MQLHTHRERFRKSAVKTWPKERDHAVFVCVDAIATRKLIWDAVRALDSVFDRWADGRGSDSHPGERSSAFG